MFIINCHATFVAFAMQVKYVQLVFKVIVYIYKYFHLILIGFFLDYKLNFVNYFVAIHYFE